MATSPLSAFVNEEGKAGEEKPLPAIPQSVEQVAQANHARVQGNVQKMLDQGGDLGTINRYLRDIEGINIEVDDTPQKVADNTTVQSLGLSVARGAIRGTIGLASLPFLATDGIGFMLRSIWDEDAQFQAVVSGSITQGGENLANLLDPNRSLNTALQGTSPTGSKGFLAPRSLIGVDEKTTTFANRAAEKVGEFIAPGGILVKGMTNQGAKLLSKNPETFNFMQRMFIQVAKDPTKAQLVEAGLGAISGISGEAAVTQLLESGNPADIEKAGYVRFGAEMASMGLTIIVQRGISSLTNLARGKLALTDKAQKLAAEIQVGKIFNEIMESDPNLLRSIRRAEQLEEAIPDLNFTTANVFQNPQIQAALTKVIQTGQPASATRYIRMLETSRGRMATFSKELAPILKSSDPNLKTSVSKFMDENFAKIDARVTAAERRAVEEAGMLHPERVPESIGQSGMEQMKILEEEAQNTVDFLYKSIDPDINYKINHIKGSLALARSDPRFAVENIQRSLEVPPKPPLGLKGREFGDVPNVLLETAEKNFGKDVNIVDMASLMEWRRMVGKHERLALSAGDTDTVARLDFLRKGVDRQFEAASKRAATGKAADVFKEANEQWTALKARFDKGYQRIGIQRDLTSIYKMAPEDFGRKFIRPESGKQAIESAKVFRQIFGVDKKGKLLSSARALITDSVAYQLSKFKTDKGFDMRAMQGWLTKHETNLKAHGVWDQFKDVGQATAIADDVRVAAVIDRKSYEQGILQALMDSPNTGDFVKRQIKNGTLGSTGAGIRATGNMPASRAWAREVFDTVLSSADTKTLDSVNQVIKRPDAVLGMLLKHKSDLVAGIGREHYKSLLTIGKALKMTEGTVRTFGARAMEPATTPGVNQRMLGRAFSKIRASLQGFISPQFTAVQLANQGLDILNSRAAQHVVEEAMYDWRYARDLARIAKDRAGQQAIRMIGVAAIPAGIDVLETEDERTEF